MKSTGTMDIKQGNLIFLNQWERRGWNGQFLLSSLFRYEHHLRGGFPLLMFFLQCNITST